MKLVVAIVLAAAVAAVLGPEAIAGLGKPPPFCNGKIPEPCVTKGGGGNAEVSPHIVRVGQKFEVSLESLDAQYAGVHSWQDPIVGGATLLKCTGKAGKKSGADQWTSDRGLLGFRRCTYKAVAPTHGWQVVRFHFNVRYGGLASESDDVLSIQPKGVYFISGDVKSKPYPGSPKEGVAIRGMRVGVFSKATKSGGGYAFSKKVTTNNAGFWEVQVPKTGTYEVLPYLRDGDRKVRPRVSLDPGRRNVRVTDTTDPEANFQLERSLGISAEIHAAKGGKIDSVRADGLTSGRLVVEVTSPNDDPMPNMTIDLRVNGASGAGAPHAKICDATAGARYWPGSSWAPAVVPDNLRTDNTGRVVATIFFGTDPGTLRITASARGNARLFDTAEVDMKTDQGIAMTPASLAKTLWGGMTNPANNGYSLVGAAYANLTTDVGGPVNIAKYLSSIRGQFDGVEFAPVRAGAATGVAFWPSGQVVQAKTGVLALPASALILPPTGLSALFSLGQRAGTIVKGYTVSSIPTVGAWRAQHAGPLKVETSGVPFGFFGGGPYMAGAIATTGCAGS